MKVAPKLLLLFRDPEGFGAAIHGALQLSPNSSLQRTESSFELSLERYEIKDHKARGEIAHFADNNGQLVVSVILIEYYEPPILACAVNEILASLTREKNLSFLLPFILSASKLKFEDQVSLGVNKSSVYTLTYGPRNEFVQTVVGKAKELPSSHIHYEPLACLVHFLGVLKLPAVALVGLKDSRPSNNSQITDLEVLCEIGKILASSLSLCFDVEGIKLKSTAATPRDLEKEPWRALYG